MFTNYSIISTLTSKPWQCLSRSLLSRLIVNIDNFLYGEDKILFLEGKILSFHLSCLFSQCEIRKKNRGENFHRVLSFNAVELCQISIFIKLVNDNKYTCSRWQGAPNLCYPGKFGLSIIFVFLRIIFG